MVISGVVEDTEFLLIEEISPVSRVNARVLISVWRIGRLVTRDPCRRLSSLELTEFGCF